MRRTLLTFILSLLVSVGWGQTYHYRYWFDNNVGGAVSGSASGEKQFSVSLASIADGFHSFHLQARNANGVWSSVRTRHFLKEAQTTAASARYWFDSDLSTEHKGVAASGIIDQDISSLKEGLHSVHYQTFNSQNIPSAVRTRFILINYPNAVATTARYWFDNNMATLREGVATSGLVELDITRLTLGLHSVHYQTFDSQGTPSAVRTRHFIVDQIQIGTLSARIWIDEDEPKEYELSNDDIVLELAGYSYGMHDLHVALLDTDGKLIDQLTQKFRIETPTVTIKLGRYGEGTFCYGHDLDFSQTNDIRAYIASGYFPQTGYVLLTRALEVPAGTGIVVRGDEGSYKVPYGESSAYYLNLLVGNIEPTTVEPTEGSYVNLFLTEGDDGFGFYPASAPFSMEANSARLQLPASVAGNNSYVKIAYEEDADAVRAAIGTTDGASFYDLSGRQQNVPQRGMNIIRMNDGTTRKVIIK